MKIKLKRKRKIDYRTVSVEDRIENVRHDDLLAVLEAVNENLCRTIEAINLLLEDKQG